MLFWTFRGCPSVNAKPTRSTLFEWYLTYGRWPLLRMSGWAAPQVLVASSRMR
jgi:hypothetical protein